MRSLKWQKPQHEAEAFTIGGLMFDPELILAFAALVGALAKLIHEIKKKS